MTWLDLDTATRNHSFILYSIAPYTAVRNYTFVFSDSAVISGFCDGYRNCILRKHCDFGALNATTLHTGHTYMHTQITPIMNFINDTHIFHIQKITILSSFGI